MNLFKRSFLRKQLLSQQYRCFSQHLKAFATVDPKSLSSNNRGMNLVGGEWTGTESYKQIVDPMNGKPLISIPETSMSEIDPFVESLQSVSKTGLHNPFKNKERYVMLGAVCRKTAEVLHDKEVFDFFVDLIMRCAPKSRVQTEGEVRVTRAFYENFSGD